MTTRQNPYCIVKGIDGVLQANVLVMGIVYEVIVWCPGDQGCLEGDGLSHKLLR